jgi:hypothetical protein
VNNNKSTVRLLKRYINGVARYFYRTTGYPTLHCHKASSNSCDADLNGWYEPEGFIEVKIPSAVYSVDLHRYTIAVDQLVSQAELADELAVNYQKRLAHAENEIRVYAALQRQAARRQPTGRSGQPFRTPTAAGRRREGPRGRARLGR